MGFPPISFNVSALNIDTLHIKSMDVDNMDTHISYSSLTIMFITMIVLMALQVSLMTYYICKKRIVTRETVIDRTRLGDHPLLINS